MCAYIHECVNTHLSMCEHVSVSVCVLGRRYFLVLQMDLTFLLASPSTWRVLYSPPFYEFIKIQLRPPLCSISELFGKSCLFFLLFFLCLYLGKQQQVEELMV